MANELRVRQNWLGGLVEDNPLTSGATTLTSASLAAMVVIGSTQYMPIILDPDGINGEPEIVWVTAHTSAATTATIVRAQESSTARAHNRDTPWVHGATTKDFAWLGTYTTSGRPSAAGAGAGAFYYDTTLSKPGWSDGTAWRDAAGTAI